MSTLAILDWGIGGFGCYKKITEILPQIPITYFSDSGFTPYGKTTPIQLKKRLLQVFDFLQYRGIKYTIVACHSAASIAKDIQVNGLTIQTIYDSTYSYLENQNNSGLSKNIALIGGDLTIRSNIYKKAYPNLIQYSAQPLSAFIENGNLGSPALLKQLTTISNHLEKYSELSKLVLACTHYPAIQNLFEEHLPAVKIVDPMKYLINQFTSFYSIESNHLNQGIIYTTGDAKKLIKNSKTVFQIDLQDSDVKKIALDLSLID